MRTTLLLALAFSLIAVGACESFKTAPKHPLGVSVACFGATGPALFALDPKQGAKDIAGDFDHGNFNVIFDNGREMQVHTAGTCIVLDVSKDDIAAAGAASVHPAPPVGAPGPPLTSASPTPSSTSTPPSAPASSPPATGPAAADKK